jgi:hypothetical protein
MVMNILCLYVQRGVQRRDGARDGHRGGRDGCVLRRPDKHQGTWPRIDPPQPPPFFFLFFFLPISEDRTVEIVCGAENNPLVSAGHSVLDSAPAAET